ncbi:hypothetical protein GP486_001473 [Trichoglossum hirsutum]|uniref:Uncharacterized protein n=1 Tax=Trichoglossum hirsutum TaxID=265104 RepID=A0A9P8RSL8_9PEZI|nr:hypothetical protein GP486_001473 [Trichoglossum hirsutum]
MATFDPIPYTYVPTAPRPKSTKALYNRAPRRVSILDKIQCIKASCAPPSTPRPPLAVVIDDDSRNDRPGIRKTGTVYDGNDKEDDDDDDDLPTIEDLLYTTLKREGFAMENSSPDHRAQGVEEGVLEVRASFIDHNRSASSDSSGSSRDNPIVQLGDDELNVSDSEVVDDSLYAKSAGLVIGSSSSSETTIESRTLGPPSNPEGYHETGRNDFTTTAQRLQFTEQKAPTSDPIRSYGPSSRPSSEPLHDYIALFEVTFPP